MKSLEPLVIVDTETLGLEEDRHVIWEVATIVGDPYADGSGYKWTEAPDALDRLAATVAAHLAAAGWEPCHCCPQPTRHTPDSADPTIAWCHTCGGCCARRMA